MEFIGPVQFLNCSVGLSVKIIVVFLMAPPFVGIDDIPNLFHLCDSAHRVNIDCLERHSVPKIFIEYYFLIYQVRSTVI